MPRAKKEDGEGKGMFNVSKTMLRAPAAEHMWELGFSLWPPTEFRFLH